MSGHAWHRPRGFTYDVCAACGVVRRADDQNKPCKGKVRVTMRDVGPAVLIVASALAILAGTCGGCTHELPLEVDVSGAEPAVVALVEDAAALWAEHGVEVQVGDRGIPVEVRTGGAAVGRWSPIEQRLILSDEFGIGNPSDHCIVAHEMGHAFGMGHVDDPRSLMAPVFAVPGLGACYWSDADEHELERVLEPYNE